MIYDISYYIIAVAFINETWLDSFPYYLNLYMTVYIIKLVYEVGEEKSFLFHSLSPSL